MSFMLDDVGLTHSNGFTALSHISLSAIQGESIALIGPSGAGKTSLLSTIGTAYLPTAGRMQVLGRTASAQAAARELKALRSRIGTVHQAAPIPLRQRVVTAVLAGKLGQWPLWKALASLAYPQDIAGAREALARVQLEDKLFARCDQLSGGQLQRVGIARVLYQQAELILADEPVSALDPALSQATVQLLVREAAARKATLVASLHAVDLALANFARIVGVRDGRLAFDLPAAQVSDAQLQALYVHTDGRAADLPMLHNRLAQRDPASITPTPIQVNACR
ncbi:phosphonate ABC transporter ATP-binding protein [Comamonas thiooxydans]|uniref:Phosphonate ABC transporter n=3 Tax=Comamonas thiooxydans TaxID=363952 RepID=A0A0E3C1M6_9BURK|nr:ATP-binding cassette domain-containing protein [Comamonas thiooxydans]KGH12287.1 phosphonate ABC transporter [Comamonas thiooxydans]KGH19198.1 phosphonate ABC transporter [Comamonas thiooxydans]KGH23173.1 phosphonate ABC transporter [Comamonas thiooxydans]